MKLKDWLPEWMDHYICPSAKAKTCNRYTEIIEQHLLPRLGEYEIGELTSSLLQNNLLYIHLSCAK